MAEIADFYGRWADLYDAVATAPGVGRWRRAAARRIASPGDTVVEMGCGSGVNLPYLRQRVGPDGHVLGVDITRPLVECARKRVVEYDNVSVVHGDARRPPVTSADGLLASFVCGLFEDPAAVVDGWCDRLDGGRMALLDATATERPLGRPLNPLFRAFVAAGSPTSGPLSPLKALIGRSGGESHLSHRVAASRTALADRSIERRYETFAVGFVGLLSGRVQ